eukprot:scaffold33456_cov15-Tisochrysis_lutea.AAC.2
MRGASVHPVYMCILNHSYSEKICCIETVAYLPQLPSIENTSDEKVRQLKLQLYHAVFDIILKPLRQMVMIGPDGGDHFVVPSNTLTHANLLAHACYSQLSSQAGTYACFNARCKCQRCLVPTESIGTMPGSYPIRMRTELHQRQIVTAMKYATANNKTAEAKRLGSKYSTHPVYSAVHDLGVVDIHEKMTHEKLHNNSLGVTRLVLRVIQRYLKANFKPRAMKDITVQLNTRLNKLDNQVQGHEHANVSKVLPHLLQGLTGAADGSDVLMDLAIVWRQHQMLCA